MTYVGSLRRTHRGAWVVYAASIAQGVTWAGLSDAVLSLYLVRMGFGPDFVGSSAAAANLGSAVGAMPAAALSRKLGPRKAMLLGTIMWVAGFAALSLADLLADPLQVPWVLATRVVASLGLVLFMVSSQPYLAEVTAPDERPHAFAMVIALRPLGAVLGGAMGGTLPVWFARLGGVFGSSLAGPRPYGMTLAVGVLVYIPVFWALATLPHDTPDTASVRGTAAVERAEHRPPAWDRLAARMRPAPWGVLIAIAAVCALRVGGEFTARAFFSVYLDATWAVSIAQIGGAIGLSSLLTIPAPLLTPGLVKRWGRAATVAVSAAAVALSILLLAIGGNWLVASAAFIGLSIFGAMARSVWSLVIQESVSKGWRQASAGVANLFSGLGTMAMSSAGGVLAATAGYRATFLTSAVLVALGAVVVWAAFRTRGDRQGPPGRLGSHGQSR